jgi:uncharacterized membrane protein
MWYGHHPQRFQGHEGGFFWIFPLLLFAALIGLLIFLLVRMSRHGGLGRRFGPGGPGGPGGPVGPGPRFGPDAAFDQARFRYARGEMSREDYFRVVEDLGWGPGGGATGPYAASAAPPPPPAPPGPPSAPTEPFAMPGSADAGPPRPPGPPAPPPATPGGPPPA